MDVIASIQSLKKALKAKHENAKTNAQPQDINSKQIEMKAKIYKLMKHMKDFPDEEKNLRQAI